MKEKVMKEKVMKNKIGAVKWGFAYFESALEMLTDVLPEGELTAFRQNLSYLQAVYDTDVPRKRLKLQQYLILQEIFRKNEDEGGLKSNSTESLRAALGQDFLRSLGLEEEIDQMDVIGSLRQEILKHRSIS